MGREGGGERGDLVEDFPPPSSFPYVTILGEEVKKGKERKRGRGNRRVMMVEMRFWQISAEEESRHRRHTGTFEMKEIHNIIVI
jgi:hypothetical protein